MAGRIRHILVCLLLMSLIVGCSMEREDFKKIRDIDFTVAKEPDIPEELAEKLEKVKKEPFEITFSDQGYLYVARGYGAQETSGYSVEIPKCYETSNLICVETELLGPGKEEKIQKKETFPYVVLKMEAVDKEVVFQ